MNATLKSILIVTLKNAVNAIITNAGLMATMHSQFYLTGNWKGIEHIGMAALSCVAAREGMYWGPKLLAWSQQTNGNGGQ